MGPISQHILPCYPFLFKYCMIHSMNIFHNTQKPSVWFPWKQISALPFIFHKNDTITVEENRMLPVLCCLVYISSHEPYIVLALVVPFVCNRTMHGNLHDLSFGILHRALGCKSTLFDLWPFSFLSAPTEIIAV